MEIQSVPGSQQSTEVRQEGHCQPQMLLTPIQLAFAGG